MKLTGGKNSTPLLIAVLVLALLFALYYYLVKPKMEQVESLESSVGGLQNEVATIEQSIVAIETERANQSDNGFAIRKKLPDNREVGSLLRNFEEIEFITGTRITNISFNGYDSLVSNAGISDPNAPSAEKSANGTPENDLQELIKQNQQNQELLNQAPSNNAETGEAILNNGSEGEAAPVTTIVAETLPPNLKLLTYSLNLDAPTPEALLLFIKEVERLERVMHVDSISYSLPGEEDLILEEDEKETMTVTLQVTTFYYE